VFLHLLFELIWTYRFLYRDLNNLLINNRTLELRFQSLLENKVATARWLCTGSRKRRADRASPRDRCAGAQHGVITTYWLSYEYVLNPRHFCRARRAGCGARARLPPGDVAHRTLFDRFCALLFGAPGQATT